MRSPKLKKVWFRKAARIQRSTINTARLDLSFVPGFFHPGRDDHGAIVCCEVGIRWIEIRLVPGRVRDTRLQIVRDHDRGNRAHELEGMDVAAHPEGELLGGGGFHVTVVARPERGYKEMGLRRGPGGRIMDRDRVAGEVDEEFFAGLIVLPEGDVEGIGPRPVAQAELAVLVAFGVLIPVLFPEELEGDVLFPELCMKVCIGGHVPPGGVWWDGVRKEHMFQGGLIEAVRERPRESCFFRPRKVLHHRRLADAATCGSLPGGEVLVPTEPKDLLYLSHR